MKKYIKPNIIVVNIDVNDQLLTISGTGEQLSGSSNGEYTEGVTLGAKGGGFWSDDEEEDYYEE